MFGGKEKFVLPLHSQTTGKASQESGSVGSGRRKELRREIKLLRSEILLNS